MRQEREIRKLSLTDLLAKPFQKIPRYRLLLQRLLEHTDQTHEDYALLRKAEKEIHELALKISTIEKESNEQESRQQQLRQLEVHFYIVYNIKCQNFKSFRSIVLYAQTI